MAHYQGWNQEELTRAGRSQEGGTYITPEAPIRTISSFTPINHGPTNTFSHTSPLTRTIDPLKTLRNIDIYDLPDDIPSLPTLGDKKRPKPRSKTSRAKTLPTLESKNSVTTDDCDYGQLEVSSPKRRKIPVKGAQPAFKVPSRVKTISTSDRNQVLPIKSNDVPSISQLTTPPDTHKRSKTRVSSATVGKRKKSSELFESLTITKPSLSYFTSKQPKDQSQSFNKLRGFTTTEEQLKVNSNGIASTTLQKLAAFRYVPRDENPSTNHPVVTSTITDANGTLDQYHCDGQIFEVPKRPSSDYGYMSSESFFEEASWIPEQVADINEPEITNPNQSQIDSQPVCSMISVTHPIPDHIECSPMLTESVPKPTEEIVLEKDQEQAQTSHDSTLLMPITRAESYDGNVEVGQLSTGRSEAAPTNPSRDYFDSDDYDDDIGDEDLLALVTNPTIPETPLESQVLRGTVTQLSPSSISLRDDLACITKMPSHHPITLSQEVTRAVLPAIAADDDDDDFPMDADLEEEMFRLAESNQGQGVVELFEPPPSLTLPSNGDDTDREVYDDTLQFSSPSSRTNPSGTTGTLSTNMFSPSKPPATNDDADWRYVTSTARGSLKTPVIQPPEIHVYPSDSSLEKPSLPTQSSQIDASKIWLDDSHEYLPLEPFARPKFPPLVQDRCPVNGLSSQTILRVCFRIGEMLKEGGRCSALGQDAIVELFARVSFSSREPGTSKQHFQFVDLFHDRPPFAKGILANFKTTGLGESESKVFIESSETLMARCLGRLKKDVKNGAWLLHIINVRVTDWEEIRWTKRIVCGEHEEKIKMIAKL